MQQLRCPVRSQEEGGIGPSPDLECRLSFAFHCRIESAKICKILNCPKIKYRIIILQLRFDILICGRNVESSDSCYHDWPPAGGGVGRYVQHCPAVTRCMYRLLFWYLHCDQHRTFPRFSKIKEDLSLSLVNILYLLCVSSVLESVQKSDHQLCSG